MYDSLSAAHHLPPAIAPLDAAGSAAKHSTANLVLKSLPAAVKSAVSGSLRAIRVEKEDHLFYQDDYLDFVYFPETAVLSEFRDLEDGRTVEVAITGREGAVGVSSLFSGGRIGNSVQVIQSGNVTGIEAGVLRSLGRRYPELALRFHSVLEQDIRRLSQRSLCNMFHSLEQRFCTWLLMFDDRCGRKVMKLTHEQIARALGVYRPSVTCVALTMRERSMIDYTRGGISIRDRRSVEEHACGCYAETEALRRT